MMSLEQGLKNTIGYVADDIGLLQRQVTVLEDLAQPPTMTLEWILNEIRLNMLNGKHCCGSSNGSSSASASATITSEKTDELAALRQRLSVVQNQSISNVITTEQAL
jgi:hypothetical protein